MYFLIDLKRTIYNNELIFWKPNSMGYTNNIKEAGMYTLSDAKIKCIQDYNQETVMLPVEF